MKKTQSKSPIRVTDIKPEDLKQINGGKNNEQAQKAEQQIKH